MNETGKPRILVTNDDGIAARGIQCLAESMTDFGDVYVIAPDSPQSGMSHAVTFSRILRLSPFEFGSGIKKAYACSGTPVDCVKLAVSEVFGHDNLPDLLVSGINHGSNASINVIYSGTMAAAADGASVLRRGLAAAGGARALVEAALLRLPQLVEAPRTEEDGASPRADRRAATERSGSTRADLVARHERAVPAAAG